MILRVENIRKRFGEKIVLDGISFNCDAGECLGIVGRSGCGKSTLVKIISRFLEPDDGSIFLDDRDITHEKNLKSIYRKLQMIFQTPETSFNPRKTIGWSISEPIRNFGIDAQVKDLLEEVGLDPILANRYPHEISGGQCQRAAIARAISISPKILICDEATSALDVTIQAQIVELLRNLIHRKRIACLFVTHDLAILPRIANRIIVLDAGKIIDQGEIRNVLDRPKSRLTQKFIEDYKIFFEGKQI